MAFESLAEQNPELRNLPRNIVLSQAALSEDIIRCRWALYRGTTAIVQAVSAGLVPVYLRLPGEMTIDPLYEMDHGRVIVETISEFQRLTNVEKNSGAGSSKSGMQPARKYCEELFLLLDYASFINLIP